MGTPDDEYENWQKLSEDGSSGFYSEPLVDKNLLKDKGILSIVYLSEDNKITVMDYSVNLKKK